MNSFDLLVIGGGPAGYNAAHRAAQGGLAVALFEKKALGGVCLNEGCIPSKTLLHSAKLYEHATASKRCGVTTQGAQLDQKTVIARKNRVVKQLTMGIGAMLKKSGVTLITEHACIQGKSGEHFTVRAGQEEYFAPSLLICTGSGVVIPPVPGLRQGLESGFVITSREALDLEEIPRKLVVVGGGVVGLELASYYRSAGSEVTVIEQLDHIAGDTDGEISTFLLNAYKRKGVDFRLGCRLIRAGQGEVEYEGAQGEKQILQADRVLCAIGRRADFGGLGLENIGLAAENGAIATDERMRTAVPGVYAAGDVNGKSMLAHTAYREGEVAVNNILGRDDVMSYDAVPGVIYTSPEVACVGLTLENALRAGIDAQCKRASMRMSGRFLAENDGADGICKLIVDRTNSRVVGAHMVGAGCSEMIYGAALMIETGADTDALKKLIFPHPTVSEVLREALFED